MEQFHQEILCQLRKNIIDDIDIDNNILEPLTCNYILKRKDIENIYTGATKEARAEKLLDVLPRYVYIFLFYMCTCFNLSYTFLPQLLFKFFILFLLINNNNHTCNYAYNYLFNNIKILIL